MILIKCKCGCHFSFKPETYQSCQSVRLKCQNCDNDFYFSYRSELGELLNELTQKGFQVFKVADDAEISFHGKL